MRVMHHRSIFALFFPQELDNQFPTPRTVKFAEKDPLPRPQQKASIFDRDRLR